MSRINSHNIILVAGLKFERTDKICDAEETGPCPSQLGDSGNNVWLRGIFLDFIHTSSFSNCLSNSILRIDIHQEEGGGR